MKPLPRLQTPKTRKVTCTAAIRNNFLLKMLVCPGQKGCPQETVTNAVYSVTCKMCDAEYIGETKRAIRIREKEHRDAIRLGQCANSAVAEHVHTSVVPHEVEWSRLQVLDRAGRKIEHKIRKAFHIYQRKPVMNRDTGVERSPKWYAIL